MPVIVYVSHNNVIEEPEKVKTGKKLNLYSKPRLITLSDLQSITLGSSPGLLESGGRRDPFLEP